MKWSIRQGDCRELIKSVPDRSIDLVVMDPPYGHNQTDGDLASHLKRALGDKDAPLHSRPIANDGPEANDLMRSLLPELDRVLKRGGCAVCCCSGGGGPDPQFARWSLWLDEVFDFKQAVVWDKGPMGLGWHYRRSYEFVLVATKRGGPCKWHDDSGRVENVIRPGDHGIRKIIPQADDHPTPKPWQLAARFINLHSLPGEAVLDPFAGHGWVGEAAVRLERHFLGFEIDEIFCRMAEKKLALAEAMQGLYTANAVHKYAPPRGLFDEDLT